jgi:Na+-driven multidrug efflux pump
MSVANRIVKNTGILYIRMGMTVFMSLYSTRIVLSALGVEDFGIFNVIGGSIAMFSFLNAAMASATQRFMSYAQGEGNLQKLKNIFNVSVVLHIIIGVFVVLILEIAGYFLFKDILKISPERIATAKLVYQFMLVSLFFTITTVPYDALINSHENMLYLAIIGMMEASLKLAIAFFLTRTMFDKLAVYGFLMAILSITILIIMRLYCHKKYEEAHLDIKMYFDRKIFKEMSGYAGWNFLFSASSLITMQGIAVLINSFFGVIVNAAQGVANQISGQLMSFSNTMLKALNPVIVKSEGENNREQMIKASMLGNKFSFLLFSFFSIPIIVEMPFILSIWLKNVPEYAIIFCRLNLLRILVSQLSVTFPTAIGATGNIQKSSQYEALIYFLLLPVSYGFFKLGASPTTIYINLNFMVVALVFSRVYFAHKLCQMPIKAFFSNIVLRCSFVSICSLIFAYIPFFFLDEGFPRLFFVLILSTGSFVPLLLYIGLTFNEKQMISSIAKKFINKLGIKNK